MTAGYLTDQKQSGRARVMESRSVQQVGIVWIPKRNWVYSEKSGYLNKVLGRILDTQNYMEKVYGKAHCMIGSKLFCGESFEMLLVQNLSWDAY